MGGRRAGWTGRRASGHDRPRYTASVSGGAGRPAPMIMCGGIMTGLARSRRVAVGEVAVPKYGAGRFTRPEKSVRADRLAPNVHLLDMNPLVTKPQHGTGSHRHAAGDSDGQGARMGKAELR